MHAEDTAPLHADTDWDWKIPLRRRDGTVRAYTLVDEATFAHLSQWPWNLACNGRYVCRIQYFPGGGKESVRMNRLLLGLPSGDAREGDHINGDRLDNRRSNLRILTKRQQQQNRLALDVGTSRHRGVYWSKRQKKWAAHAKLAGKDNHLGYFTDEHEAGRVAAEYRAAHLPFSVAGR